MRKLLHTNIIGAFIRRRSHNAIERQQVIVYLVSVTLGIVGMSLHLLSVLGANDPVLLSLSLVFVAAEVVPFILWNLHRLSLSAAFITSCVIIQVVQSVKIVFITMGMQPQYFFLVVINGIVSTLMMCLLAISYMHIGTVVVGVLNFLTLLFASVRIEDKWMWQFTILVALFSIFFCLLTELMYRNVKHLQDENIAFRNGEHILLQILRLNRKEILAYIEMCSNDNPKDKDTDRLFAMLNERSQRNVINAVERKKALEASRKAELKTLFPDFTPMELEVSRLILQDKKLKQIMELTGKNESNISTVRSHIRKKMGLASTQDLRKALLEKVHQ